MIKTPSAAPTIVPERAADDDCGDDLQAEAPPRRRIDGLEVGERHHAGQRGQETDQRGGVDADEPGAHADEFGGCGI